MAALGKPAFFVFAESTICTCGQPRALLYRSLRPDTAIRVALGHWSVYTTFWGHLFIWCNIIVVDARDQTIIWKNGKPTGEQTHGANQATASQRGLG